MPERLPHLLRRYAETGEGEAAGFGLGLVICRGLVEAHGGRIRVESAGPGLGARYTIAFPAVAEAVARPPRTNGPAHELILDSRRSPSLDLKPTSLAPLSGGESDAPERARIDAAAFLCYSESPAVLREAPGGAHARAVPERMYPSTHTLYDRREHEERKRAPS